MRQEAGDMVGPGGSLLQLQCSTPGPVIAVMIQVEPSYLVFAYLDFFTNLMESSLQYLC